MLIDLFIQTSSAKYKPVCSEKIVYSTEKQGACGTLSFTIIRDSIIDFSEGDIVSLSIDGTMCFYGYVFTKKRTSLTEIQVTAYDQIRYLKNKYTYAYTNKTASELLYTITNDFMLETGTIEDTGFKIASRIESNKTLIDIIQTALDLTFQNKNTRYILFDDCGKLSLKNCTNMQIPIVLQCSNFSEYEYSSTIDIQTYNKVIAYKSGKYGVIDYSSMAKDDNNIAKWGILQLFSEISDDENALSKAQALLEQYNNVTRNLSITNALGDIRVHAGCMITVQIDLGDLSLNTLMLVEKCTHIWSENEHFMNLTLSGGEFIA